MLDILIKNYLLLSLLIGFTIIVSNELKTIKTERHDRIKELLIVVVVLTISSVIRGYYRTLDHYTMMVLITSYLCYILRPAVIILFISLLSNRKFVKYLSLLCIINTAIYTTCFFNSIAFSVTATNELIKGPLFYSSYTLNTFYFLLLLSIVIKQYSAHNKVRTVILLLFMIICVGASYLDIKYNYVNLFDSVLLICGLQYYLFLYIEYNRVDVLTSTFNRASFYNDIVRFANKVTSVISIDMNNLKTINDTLGHDEGDKAIVTISDILLHVDPKNVRIYRVGGDEFVALCFYKAKEDVNKYIKNAKKELSKTNYNCSFGYSYKDNDDVYEVYKQADNEMYKEKEEYHKKHGIKR